MAHNDDPPWLRAAPTLVLSRSADGSTSESPRTNQLPAPLLSSDMTSTLATPPILSTASDSESDSEDGYVGWRPQLTTVQQAAQAPPLSPLDLAMYPGAPLADDPAAARKAVAGLRPLRILSSRRPGGPSSAGPSRPPSTGSTPGTGSAARSSFMGFLSAARRASEVVASSQAGSSASSPRAQSLSISHAPIPVSPLPPPRTPPLVPPLRLAPELESQMEPMLKAYLESLASQAASKPSLIQTPPRRGSSSQVSQLGPIGLTEEEQIMLGIRDLDAGGVISVRNLDVQVVNRKSQSTSQRLPRISEFSVIRDLETQPRTAALAPPQRLQSRRPLTPTPPSSPIKLLSPVLLVPDSRRSQLSPVTPFTEAAHVNHDLELSLYDLERALGRNPQSHSHSRSVSTFSSSFGSRNDVPRTQARMYTPHTARTTSSHVSSVFSSRTVVSPLTTPPASPPPLPQPFTKQTVELPCMVCSRPMQNMTSIKCGHVFCRGCVEGRSACPVCRAHVQDNDLRAIHLSV